MGSARCSRAGGGLSAFLSGSEPRRPQDGEENRGKLLRIQEAEGQCIAVYSWGAVALPGEMIERLRELVGQKCAILRIDGRFLVRNLEGEEHAA